MRSRAQRLQARLAADSTKPIERAGVQALDRAVGCTFARSTMQITSEELIGG